MTQLEILKLQKKVAKKMLAAIAMLLVATTMLVGVSYAWVSISSAPEASKISTTVGANGALEIALQSNAPGATSRRAEITSGRGSSSAVRPAIEANKTWGNVVDLGEGYGLEAISLYPSRINVNNVTTSVNTNGYLSIPAFGKDGRITKLDPTSFLTFNGSGDGASFTEGRVYGVNILGTVSDETLENETIEYHYRRSLIRDEAAGYLEQYRTSLRDQLTTMLEDNQIGLFNLLLRASKLLNSEGQVTGNTWSEENVATVKTIISRMISITRESEASLKWALLAQAVADDITYPQNDEEAMTSLGTLYRNFLTYPLTSTGDEVSIKSIAISNGYDDLADAVDSIIRSENQLAQALTYISSEDTVTNACLLIIDVQNTFLKNGSEIETSGAGTGNPATGTPHRLYERVDNTTNYTGIYYNYVKKKYSDYLYFTSNPTGTTYGLFSIMANLLGDYQATEEAFFTTAGGGNFTEDSNNGRNKLYTLYIRGSGKSSVSLFNVNNNRGVLGTVYDDIMSYDPGNSMISFSVNKMNGTAYGYSVDLAFRANENCDLLLKTVPTDRTTGVSMDDENNFDASSPTLGSGSNESFTLSGDLIGANSDSAKELMQNIYIVLTDTDSGQILGIVCAEDPEVVLEQGTASLAIYEPVISEAGILTKGIKRSDYVITSLVANQTAYVTAIVFLNGDTMYSGAVSSTQNPSLYGTINLQFAASEQLVPVSFAKQEG